MKRLLASIVDEIIIFGGSALIYLLIELIMNLIGFRFTGFLTVYIIIAAVLSVIYFPIVESTGLNNTIGKKIFDVK